MHDEFQEGPGARNNSMTKYRDGSTGRKKRNTGTFVANSFTKDLKSNKGNLPFRKDGDRIARYGKGFSNLLNIVGSPH